MPRPRTQTQALIVERALPVFWRRGYGATSLDDLIRQTGASRHALYQAVAGKHELFLACLDAYSETIVTPAFGRLERAGAGLQDVAAFLEQHIAAAEADGLPGPGCLFANTATEVAPHDPAVAVRIGAHHARLTSGFRAALVNTAPHLSPTEADDIAAVLTIGVQGLWSMSRTMADAAALRRCAASLIDLITSRITPCPTPSA